MPESIQESILCKVKNGMFAKGITLAAETNAGVSASKLRGAEYKTLI